MLSGSLFSISLGTTAAITAILSWPCCTMAWAPRLSARYWRDSHLRDPGRAGRSNRRQPDHRHDRRRRHPGRRYRLALAGRHHAASKRRLEFLARTFFGLPFSVYVFLGLALVLDLRMRHTRFGLEIYSWARISRRRWPLACRSRFSPPRPSRSPASASLLQAFSSRASRRTLTCRSREPIRSTRSRRSSSAQRRHWRMGSVGRTVVRALIIATVTNMLLLVGASTGMQILVKGMIVTMVVVLLHLSRRERRSP